MSEQVYHTPAMLEECMQGLAIRPGGTYVDVTFGGGGHSRAVMERLGPQGRLIGLDQDMDAYANRIDDPRFLFVRSNFRYLANFLEYHGIGPVDGILADLGVSFHHFDAVERGFSFRGDAPLDMRMNRDSALTARTVLNSYDMDSLGRILRDYGDLKRPGPVLRAIEKARSQGGIDTTGQLTALLESVLNPRQLKKEMAQVFQALRIEVNGEMNALARFLQSTPSLLRPGGRLVVLTYHSLEDRMVKNFMRSGNPEGIMDKDFYGRVHTPWRLIEKGAQASAQEIERNPRARSARLRVAEYDPSPTLQTIDNQ